MFNVMRAVEVAKSVAASLDLPATDGIVIQHANRLTLRLMPCDVLARVASVEHGAAQFELALASRLIEAGCPVGSPEPRVHPVVYTRDGFDVTLWVFLESVAPHTPARDYAEALELLHAGMRKVDAPAPGFTDRITEAVDVVANPELSPELPEADRAFLSSRLRSLRQEVGRHGAAEQLLHGEPHRGNVITTKNGPMFVDLETYCRGPVEFDLAHVPAAACERYPNVDHELLDACRELVLAMVAAWRWERGDVFPNSRRFGEECLRALRAGPPWPTLDMMNRPVSNDGPPSYLTDRQ